MKICHHVVDFDIISNKEFYQIFLNIISRSAKDNTYKFALARFLLEYSNRPDPIGTHVDFRTIAEYFLGYYWNQICKLKMKHAPQTTKKPEIVTIIEEVFPEKYYPQTFNEMRIRQPERIKKCTDRIVKQCFHNVTWRFQRIKAGRTKDRKVTLSMLFFEYKINRTVNSNKKYVDLEYGINLNPNAIKFFRENYAVLLKAVILEWARFLEKLNIGMPKIIAKTDGRNIKRGALTKYRQLLEPICSNCFYCSRPLEQGRLTHVEHVIPFDYIAEDNIWNLTLACQECNLHKLGALPPMKYINKLIERNSNHSKDIPMLERSIERLDVDFERTVINHYNNAKSQGYAMLKKFP